MERVIQKACWQMAVLCTLLFAGLFYAIFLSPVGVAGLTQITGGASILDYELAYNKAEAFVMLTRLGEEGRDFYLGKILPLDFAFPFAYMLCYASWIALLVKHTLPLALGHYLMIAPVAAMLCDWFENLGIIAMLANYPELPSLAVTAASVGGVVKLGCIIGSVSTIAGLLALHLHSRAKARRRRG